MAFSMLDRTLRLRLQVRRPRLETNPTMKVVDVIARSADYRLNLLGVRVWEDSCQLIAKGEGSWSTLGARRLLPLEVPTTVDQLKGIGDDPLG